MTVTIKVEGLDRVLSTLNKLKGAKYMGAVLGTAAAHIQGKIAKYPRVNRDYPLKWASEKQRRGYFATRRKKGLPPGYTRQSDPMSQRLGPSWTTRVEVQRLYAEIGTSATYAPFVQSRALQTAMHKATGWETAEDVAEKEATTVLNMVMASLDKALL